LYIYIFVVLGKTRITCCRKVAVTIKDESDGQMIFGSMIFKGLTTEQETANDLVFGGCSGMGYYSSAGRGWSLRVRIETRGTDADGTCGQ
jgi:hypothetical protein